MNEENINQNIAKDVDRTKINEKSKEQKIKVKNRKNKTRMYIVLAFILLVAIVGYVIFRGEYLEILELGEQYTNIFWQNVNYTTITFGINFVFLFIIIFWNNNRIKKALKPFFEAEKKKCQSFLISQFH